MSGKTIPLESRPKPRNTIAVQGARVHNLKNVSVELPRNQLIVVTGLSGSGKSSLAFDTIYAEGQRRYLESLSSYAKRFVAQVAKPDVDFIFGLSPVISIEQKTISSNPRSTVGTMTDIASYLNLLFATIAVPHCPRTGERVPSLTPSRILEIILSLPEGAEIEMRAPVFKVYGEELDFVLTEVRKKGCRLMIIDGKQVDISNEISIDADDVDDMDAIVDRFIVSIKHEKAIKAGVAATLLTGDGLMRVEVLKGASKQQVERFHKQLSSHTHHFVYGGIEPEYFMFNNPESACRTCGGLGIHKITHPELLVPDTRRSIRAGCFVKEAYKYNPDTWDGRIIYSLSKLLNFSLDTPWQDLPEAARHTILYGLEGRKLATLLPPDAKDKRDKFEGHQVGFHGIARRIERHYRRYRQRGEASSGMEAWLDKVMVERTCPDCNGARLRATRLLFTIGGETIHDVGNRHFDELHKFLGGLKPAGRGSDAGRQVIHEIRGRLELLLGIGLDYLNLNRRSGTLSGGESQRIRLSTQIGSGLMGMLYVLDEPSIGLHPKDNAKMIATLENLRDIGNTVIVVEHDEDTIRAADHIVEMGPGAGIHGGSIVAQGLLKDITSSKVSPTGLFFSGKRSIAVPRQRRKASRKLVIRGARENNLKSIDVAIPLGVLVAVTGASGSGKSTLVKEILYKALWKRFEDTRTLPGAHEGIDGLEHVHKVVNIDQSPIGRNSRSNPATYIGFYDAIRELFAQTPLAVEREYKSGRFSFNVKGGRCEECQGEGVITTQLYFMPDVEVICGACKGARFGPETLEVTLRGKTITDVLNMSIEEGAKFFAGEPAIGRKIEVLADLGLGYLTLGQSATTLSGGEAQRVKIAVELSKLQRSKHTLYILDEPTTGLHLADVEHLLECLNRLVRAGHTVLVVEHHLDVIKTADYVIDLGPEGGHAGGEVVATGTPEAIAASRTSYTGRFLKQRLANA
jgi:excinuclease ABC subunit A